MFQNKKVVGIIPARGGSKRLPGKNIAIVASKPLLGWTIEASLASKHIDKVVLTTDDPNIAKIGDGYDVDEIHDRPKSLAGDKVSTNQVVLHTLRTLQAKGEDYGYLILLQPTSPLRTSRHIDEAFYLIDNLNGVGAASITRTDYPIEWMGKLPDNGFLDSFIAKADLDKQHWAFTPSYQINGSIYILPVDKFIEEQSFYLKHGMVAYIMDRLDSVDIDDLADLMLADQLLRTRNNCQN